MPDGFPAAADGVSLSVDDGADRNPRIAGVIVHGYAAVWFDPADPGTRGRDDDGADRRIKPGAFDAAPALPVVLWADHERGTTLARVTDGTLRVWPDARGLRFAATLPDAPHGCRMLRLVGAGAVGGASGGYSTPTRNEYRDGRRRVRELAVARLVEISLTDRPRFAGACVLVAEAPGVGPWPADLAAVLDTLAEMTSRMRADDSFFTSREN